MTVGRPDVGDMSVGVAVITHRAREHLHHCLPPLLRSPLAPRVLMINSSSHDGTVVVPNGVDTGFFGFASLKGRGPGILYVGRLGYRKGLFRLLDAFARLPPDLGRELILAGEGPLESSLRRRAAALGIAGRVRFAGFLDRLAVRAELRDAACFVNPADYETGPLTLLEALACGVPVVSTATGLAVELGSRPPLILTRPDPQALAKAIEAVLRDPALATLRAREGRALMATRFDWEHAVDRLESIYGLRQERAA